ncbi:coiled-coil domain-containing protein 12-like [Tubulanus polymorphus]|uniref:coiled-coil domain-containing protein 12-like n=1 Tax=Tubulanus polymorphus TaxID=672921 RepID=UPI003DA1FD67
MASKSDIGNLQTEAQKRKERLKNLREKRELEDEPASKRLNVQNEDKLPKPVFRSYKPQDQSLKANELPKVKPLEIKDSVKERLEDSKPTPVVEEVDLANLAPRKPDWDLKRDIAKKLAKLEKRTQRAIAELIKERMQSGKTDLATAVSAMAQSTND